MNNEERSKADFTVGNIYFLSPIAFLLKYSEILLNIKYIFPNVKSALLILFKEGKRKKEVSSRFIFVFVLYISVQRTRLSLSLEQATLIAD